MGKVLNITNFDETAKSLNCLKSKITKDSYFLMFDMTIFNREIVCWNNLLQENIVVKKIIIELDREIDEETDIEPLTKLSLHFLDSFEDIVDKESYLIPTTKIKEKIVQLIEYLKKPSKNKKHEHF